MVTAFQLADDFVDQACRISPVMATFLGVPDDRGEWGESLSLEGVEAMAELSRDYRNRFIEHVADPDRRQSLAARVTIGGIDERLAEFEAGDHLNDLRHLGSAFHMIPRVFDMMPKSSTSDWEAIRSRLASIGKPFSDYLERLDLGRRSGLVVARRQAESVAEQAEHLAGDDSAFSALLQQAGEHGGDGLESAVAHARSEAATFAAWLRERYLPDASDQDGVGEEVYRRKADRLVGIPVDPEDAYQWGWEELSRLFAEMESVGRRILPGATLEEVRAHLETDPSGVVGTRGELIEFVTAVLDRAVEELSGRHFDVPEAIRPLTVQMAPAGSPLGAYYTPPSEDFSRPGGVWYSVGNQENFPLYKHVSTAYHEGFPGHHLQIATVKYRKEDLSRTQRSMTWYPGYSEGWGMYAEVLMGELGYLEDPAHYLGMLTKQAYRAARVVVDIGLHLGYRIPDTTLAHPGETWSFESAVEAMRVYGFQTPAQAEAEVLRYLGWPGQAITYKLGEKEILSIREEARQRLGPEFDLKEFHAAVINHGSMRLDLLREVVAETLY
jgi:uncharacterized protein (DUF885 family)